MVKEENGRWYVYNHTGEKRLSTESGYATKEEANKRIQQVEAFKHMDEDILASICDESQYEDAEYKGKSVTLNKPFRTPNESKKFAVYAKNPKGNVVKVRFGDPDMEIKRDDPEARKNFRSRHKCDLQKDKSTPGYWSCRMWAGGESVKEVLDHDFRHRVFFDASTKRLRSVRDGVQEYLGMELGVEPYDRVFTVYRSPETISAIASDMDGLPIINEHIDPSNPPANSQIIGRISDTDVVEEVIDDYDSTLVLENKANVSDETLKLRDNGKKEFSLGYTGKMREHDTYDFEQYDINISTGHLALVDAARGGSVLTFVDKKEKNMDLSKIFLDADGSVNLQKVVDISSQLSEAIKTVPIEKLVDVVPVLEEVVMYGKQGDPADVTDEEETEVTDMEEEKTDMEMDYEDMEEEEKEKFADSKLVKSYVKTLDKSFKDSTEFKDAIAEGIKSGVETHVAVVDKARDFLEDDYSFGDKPASQIMRDSIKVMTDEEFTDSELSAAFKMLKKSDQYKAFGDTADELQALRDKEL